MTTRSRLRDTSIEATVGFFVFLILMVLAVFTIILSRQALFSKTSMVEVRFAEVMGIREGDNIFLRGVNVGKIRNISMGKSDVRIVMGLNTQLRLHRDYRIEVLSTSVLGGRYLNIFEGTPTAPEIPADSVLNGVTPVDLVDQATRTVQALRTTLVDGGMLENLRNATEKLNAVANRIEAGEGTVGKLIRDDTVYNQLKAIADDLRTVSGKLARGESSLGRFLADDGKMYNDAEVVIANLKTATDNVAQGKGMLGKLVSSDESVYDDLKATAENLREITATLNRGEGTLGKLIKDDGLYKDARYLVNELRSTIDDFRETSPLTTFTSIFFGAF